MPDLRLTDGSVAALRGDLTRVADELTAARGVLGGCAAQAAGAPKLVARLDDFADDWSYGLGRLVEQVGCAVTDLDAIARTFADVDARLAEGLGR